MSDWSDRIVETSTVAPDQLLANPNNWRIHPSVQRQAVRDTIAHVGWVQTVIVNVTTGHLVDGHLRVGIALAADESEVPVTYVRLSEAEERKALLSLDPLTNLASTDDEQLRATLEAIADESAAEIAARLHDLEKPPKSEDTGDGDDDGEGDDDDETEGTHGVFIECGDETEQESLYAKLTGEGYKVRVVNT